MYRGKIPVAANRAVGWPLTYIVVLKDRLRLACRV